MKIFLVDDNEAFRNSLHIFLGEYLNHEVVGESNDGQAFIEKTQTYADIILMDINMPGLNGIETTKKAIWDNPDYKIIAVSQYKDNMDLHQLISVGFKGFVSKVNVFRDLENALNAVIAGKLFFPDELSLSSSLMF